MSGKHRDSNIRVHAHLNTDVIASHVHKHLKSYTQCREQCCESCFEIVDRANMEYELELRKFYISTGYIYATFKV